MGGVIKYKTIFLIISVITLLPIVGHGEIQDLSSRDGNDWREWDMAKKHNFVSGFMAGSDYATSYTPTTDTADLALNIKVARATKGKKMFTAEDMGDYWRECRRYFVQDARRYQIIGITNNQIVDGLNILYDDFKNRSIKIADAIYVVKNQVVGTPQDEIDRILIYLRSGNADALWVRDEKGTPIKIIEFP